MNKNVYFVSDAHLGLKDGEKEEYKKSSLIEFIKMVRKEKAALYIVGDFFDFWIEYKYVIPRHFFKVVRALQEAAEDGCEIHIFGGNHDFWLGSFFTEELGVIVHPDPLRTEIEGKKFFIAHGDGILKRDRGYRILKRVLRNRFCIFLFKLIHPDIAFRIAEFVSGSSRHLTIRDQKFEENEKKEIIQFGTSKINEGFDCVVTGHFHLPTNHKIDGKQIINLGDWMKYFTYGYFDGEMFSLCYWDKPKNSKSK
jgi:UDP-2,3-diacylglucosamine hydrolase